MVGVTGDWGVGERGRGDLLTSLSESIRASSSLMSTPSLMFVCLNVEGQDSLLWLVGRLETEQSVYLIA